MSVEKIIKFYVVEVNPSVTLHGINIDSHLFEIFNMAFKNGIDYYSFPFNKKDLFFDIISFDKDCLFGTCSVPDNIKPTSMIQERNNKTKIPKPFTSVNDNSQLEAYTFFYVDFKNCRMAVIANRKISRINEIICSFIKSNTNENYIAEIQIQPERIKNLQQTLNDLKSKDSLEIEFFAPKDLSDIRSISESLKSEFTTKKYKITFKLEETKESFIPALLNYKNNVKKNNVPKINLSGKNDLGLEETIDLFEMLYTKTIPLELTDDTITNTKYIQQQLNHYLELHINNLLR